MASRALGAVTVAALAVLFGSAPAQASAPAATFPIPGSQVVSPQAQIAFRGLTFSQLQGARIIVTGSKSGIHTGTLAEDSDGRGGSFLPATPFTAGEVVTVSTSLRILNSARPGTFHFTVAQPAPPIPFRPPPKAPRVGGDVWQFRSAPGLAPTAVKFTYQHGKMAPGDVFFAPMLGPLQYGPEMVDQQGNLVWTQPAPAGDKTTNFRVQTYLHQPVLTYWQGYANEGFGVGQDVILNNHYQQIATVQAANGLKADLHEFQLTKANSALITSAYPVYWNASSIHHSSWQPTFDSVIQEIDIKTGLVLFQWDSLDHVPLIASYNAPASSTSPFDYFHANSVAVDSDGSLIISARNTWGVYKVNHRTAATIWTLGGKFSSFKMEPGTTFAFQHDVEVHSGHDWYFTVFDDGGGPPQLHPSRGLKLFLDTKHRRAWRAGQYIPSGSINAFVEGNDQQLPNLHQFLGWGSAPFFTEFDAAGHEIFAGRMTDQNASYRAYRFPWNGAPTQPPAVAASSGGGQTQVYASWNGATSVASWRVLAGSRPGSLAAVATAPKQGFETEITIPAQQYVAAQALGTRGQVLGQSSTVSPS